MKYAFIYTATLLMDRSIILTPVPNDNPKEVFEEVETDHILFSNHDEQLDSVIIIAADQDDANRKAITLLQSWEK